MKMRRLPLLAGVSLLMGAAACWLNAQSFQFTNVQRLTNKELVLSLAAPTGRAYRLESSTNATDWNGLLTFATNITTSLQHTDSAAPYLSTRYYRASQLTGTNLISGDHLTTTNGDVIIQPRFHASFVMQWNGLMIYNDPAPSATYVGLPKADLILVSHTHGDHFNTAHIDAVRGANCIIIVSQAVFNGLTAAQKTNAIILANGASTNILGLTVSAVPAYNGNHPLGAGNGYVLNIGGKRIYASGDTGDQTEIRALADIDVAFLCMNQPFTMTVNAATNCIRVMRPKVVYPYHYRDDTGATTNAATFKQWLGTDPGIEVRLRKWY